MPQPLSSQPQLLPKYQIKLLTHCHEDKIISKILLSLNKAVEFFTNKETDLNSMHTSLQMITLWFRSWRGQFNIEICNKIFM